MKMVKRFAAGAAATALAVGLSAAPASAVKIDWESTKPGVHKSIDWESPKPVTKPGASTQRAIDWE